MRGFIDFIRERGVVGFAVAFILGSAITKVVSSLVSDIVNPMLGLILSRTKSLGSMYFKIAGAKIMWGHFISVAIDFLILSAVVYFIVKGLRLEKIDKRKDLNK
jgi:large conductance mechanosensitive channel